MTAPRPDHVMYVVSELESGIASLERATGVRAAYGGEHAGLGTHNALLDLGDRRYLEILAPISPDSPALAPGGLLAGVEPPRVFMWAAACEDITRAAEAARERGYDPGQVVDLRRTLPSGHVLRWKLSIGGADVAGSVVPFLIQWENEPHPSLDAPKGCEQVALEARHPDPERIARAFAALNVEMPIARGERPELCLHMTTPRGDVTLR